MAGSDVPSTATKNWMMTSVLIGIGAISLLVAIVLACTGPAYKYRLTYAEATGEQLRTTIIIGGFGVALLAALLSYFASWPMTNSKDGPHRFQFWLRRSLVAGAVFGFLGWGILYNGIRSTISPTNECLNNLKRIDQAIYAVAENGQNPSMINQNSLTKFLNGRFPACPTGGKYTIGTLTQSSTCSSHGTLD